MILTETVSSKAGTKKEVEQKVKVKRAQQLTANYGSEREGKCPSQTDNQFPRFPFS